jgi:TonB family protein
MRLIVVMFALGLGLGGCTLAEQGAMLNAYQSIDRGDYRSALKDLAAAGRYIELTAEQRAEIAFLKGKCYEGLNDVPSAIGMYRYIVATFLNSQYSYQAQQRLEFLAKSPGSGPGPASLAGGTVAASDPNDNGVPARDAPPHVISQTKPEYPPEMDARQIPGDAVVEFTVETNGSVQNAWVVSQTNEAFGHAALAFVQHWKFNPALKAGVPVRTVMRVPVHFRYEPDSPVQIR